MKLDLVVLNLYIFSFRSGTRSGVGDRRDEEKEATPSFAAGNPLLHLHDGEIRRRIRSYGSGSQERIPGYASSDSTQDRNVQVDPDPIQRLPEIERIADREWRRTDGDKLKRFFMGRIVTISYYSIGFSSSKTFMEI